MTTSNSQAAAEQHLGLHHRIHAANGDIHPSSSPSSADYPSSSNHPADVEAAITAADGGKEEHSKDVAVPAADEEEQYADVTYSDIFKQFSILGWTAFGGPAAHIGLFQRVRTGGLGHETCMQQLIVTIEPGHS